MKPQLKIHPVEGPVDLYCRYPGRPPQGCHLALDLNTGHFSAGYTPELTGYPITVHNGTLRRYSIACLKQDAANTLLEELRPYAECILTDSEVRWNGSNYVGVLGTAAQEAELALHRLAEDTFGDFENHLQVCDARDYYANLGDLSRQAAWIGIALLTDDLTLQKLEAREEVTAAGDGVDLLDGLGEYLTFLRDGLIEEALEEITTAENLTALLVTLRNIPCKVWERDYSVIPTWGDKTAAVDQFINRSGPERDLVSWDTENKPHRCLWRETVYLSDSPDGGVESQFEITTVNAEGGA